MTPACQRFTELLPEPQLLAADQVFVGEHAQACEGCASFRDALTALGADEPLDALAARRLVAQAQAAFAEERRAARRRSLGWVSVALAAAAVAWAVLVPHERPAPDLFPAAVVQPGDDALRQAISAAIHAQVNGLTVCAEQFYAVNPTSRDTKLVVSFTITAAGAVTDARLTPAPAAELAPWERCVLDVVKTLRFAPMPSGQVEVTYPFVFKANAVP